MKISVITVSYNSAAGIAKTMESVLGQTLLAKGEDTVEYLIIDGASTDGTPALAEDFRGRAEEKGVALRIVSEPDKGIYDAMNKGIRLASGDVIGILNTGDWYEPETLETVAETFRREDCGLLFADIRIYRAGGSSFVKKARLRDGYQTSRDWNHPTMFVRAGLYKAHPFCCKGIHDDYGCYLELRKAGVKAVTVDQVLANFTMGGASNQKSLRQAIRRIRDRYRYCYRRNGYSRLYLAECVAIEAAKLLLG